MSEQMAAGRGLILGIESSCDETAAAVVARGREVLSSVVASQGATHALYGGVVPELASREHLRNIVPVVRGALREAGVGLAELDAIAVTEGPGLAGALLVGVTYAKTLAWALGKPLVAVNHLEGHIHAVLLEHAHARPEGGAAPVQPMECKWQDSNPDGNPDGGLKDGEPRSRELKPPEAGSLGLEDLQTEDGSALALVVSGGHTHLYLASEDGKAVGWRYRLVGQTVDDAAGEAFDKVAKLLGLPYPGGPWLDALAAHGDARTAEFRFAEVRPREGRQRVRAQVGAHTLEELFSFSGIKTAVLRYVESHGMLPGCAARAGALNGREKPTTGDVLALCDRETLGLIASFQRAVVGNLVDRTMKAARRNGVRTVLVSGGVAANRELRARFAEVAGQAGVTVLFPSVALATDNAAMIAAAAWPRFAAGMLADDTLSSEPRLSL